MKKWSAITHSTIIEAYSKGIFPMALYEDGGSSILWFSPDPRCVIPIDEFHISRSLKRTIRKHIFEITVDKAFEQTVRNCAAPRVESPGRWLSEDLIDVFCMVFERGNAHSIEVWKGDDLVGGLFGVSVGGLFAGESMYHRVTDASKVALWATNECLRYSGYHIFDVQMMTDHLARFGAKNISREEYCFWVESVAELKVKFQRPPQWEV